MNLKKLKDKKYFIFFTGILLGLLFAIIALIIFNEISFILGGISIMIIGFSFMYYLTEIKRTSNNVNVQKIYNK